MSAAEHNVLAFLAREEAADILRARRAADRANLRDAIDMAQAHHQNDGAERLIRWVEDRFSR